MEIPVPVMERFGVEIQKASNNIDTICLNVSKASQASNFPMLIEPADHRPRPKMVLEQFGMKNSKPTKTPIEAEIALPRPQKDVYALHKSAWQSNGDGISSECSVGFSWANALSYSQLYST